MPSKRANDSVDEILQELDRQQAAQSVRGSMTERQVDDILRSVGVYEQPKAAPVDLGPIEQGDMPAVELGQGAPDSDAQRFSTAVLDDILKDLPSLRAVQSAQPKQAPAPARRPAAAVEQRPAAPQPAPQPAPEQPAQRPAAVEQQPAPPQPAPQDTGTLGDTTRSGIIKNFLRKMAPDAADASQGALNQGKKEFQRFFAESAAVVPDEHGHLKPPSKRKRGLFGLGSVEDTDEFVPINVSLTGPHGQPAAPEEPDEPAMPDVGALYDEDAAPAPPKKKGFFARMFGHPDTEELYIPESREPEQPAPAHRGVVFEDETASFAVPPEQPSMQLPVENIRSRYTAGRGNGLDIPPAISLSQADEDAWLPAEPAPAPEAGSDRDYSEDEILADLGMELPAAPPPYTPESDPLSGLLPGTSTLEFLRQMDEGTTVRPKAAPTAPGGVYRKKRTTVEFTPGQRTQAPAPQPYRAPGPVGEPVQMPAAPAPEPPAAEPQPEPAPAAQTSGGFTMRIGDDAQAEDTQLFLDAYGQARALRRARPEPATGEVELAPPPAPADDEAQPAPAAPAQPAAQPAASPFVQGIEQSINAAPADEAPLPDDSYMQAAYNLMGTAETPPAAAPLRFTGVPEDEQTETPTSPFIAAPHAAQHSYEKPEDEPAVRRDLDRQTLVLGVSSIVTGVLALLLIVLGAAAFGGVLPGPLSPQAGATPLLATMLVLLAAACALNWRTLLWGAAGLVRSPTPDSMPALAAFGALLQLIVFLAVPTLYDPDRFCLLAGAAALLLCANAAGKLLDAHTLRAGFGLVTARTEHAVARRLVDSGMLQAATQGLAEPRPCVLISRPTELFKGFLTSATARRPSDKNQQQMARGLLVCAVLSLLFTLIYHRDAGKAVTALAAVFCLGAPLAGTLISALPAYLMQRSAAQVGAVIPGWHDIRQLGRINVIHLATRDLFPQGSVRLCGIKPVHKEQIDRAIMYAASLLSQSSQSMQSVFLSMIGGNRKLLAKVDDFETIYGKGCIGWIEGERVLAGNRALMEEFGVKIPGLEYEQRYSANQRRFLYLAVSGKLFSVFQLSYQRDADTAAVLDGLRAKGISLVIEQDDFNVDAELLQTVYGLQPGAVKVLTAEERETLEPATAWLPESSGSMMHLGSFASFVGGLGAAAGAAAGEQRAGMVLTASVLLSAVLALIMSVPALGITALPLPALVLYQVAWAVLALIFPILQRY